MVVAPIVCVAAVITAGCAVGPSDGPRMRICDDWIGRAEIVGSSPFYVDASSDRHLTVTTTAGSSPTWVRVSGDCAHGVRVSAADPHVIRVSGTVPAKDGADEAVLVSPEQAGRGELTVTGDGVPLRTVIFTVSAPPPLPTTPPGRRVPSHFNV